MIFPQEQTTSIFIRISVIRPVKQNQLSFPSIEINKALLAPVHNVSQIRFKFRNQFKLLPHIRCLITLRIESSITSTDSNITDNIIRKVINVLQEKCRTKNEALWNFNINWILKIEDWRLPIENQSMPSLTEKRRNKAKYLT